MPEMDDHSLLIRLDEKMTGLVRSVEEMKTSLPAKVEKDRVDGIEHRLADAEKKIWIFAGVLLTIEAVLKFVVKL